MPALIRDGELDVGLRAAAASTSRRVAYAPLHARAAGRRAAGAAALAAHACRLPTLADEPFILFPREAGAWLYDAIVGFCRGAGFTPRIEQEAIQMQTIVSLVAAGMGVALVPASLRHMRRTGVVYRAVGRNEPGGGNRARAARGRRVAARRARSSPRRASAHAST